MEQNQQSIKTEKATITDIKKQKRIIENYVKHVDQSGTGNEEP